MSYFAAPEEALDYWFNSLTGAKSSLGLQFIGYADERLVPHYPAIMLGDIALTREIHATRQFMTYYAFNMFVYHAKLTSSRRTRVRDDLLLVTALRSHFHADKECKLLRDGFDPGVIFGMITDESPGIVQRGKGDAVIGTRMAWSGRAITSF